MSKSRISQILAASMEDIRAEDAATAPVVDDQTADNAAAVANPETLESDLIDVNQAESDVQTNSDAVAELDEVHEGLEAIALSLESAANDGGLNPQSAQFMHIAFESYCARLGEPANVPSLESFGGQTSRVDATRVSMETVKEMLSRVWEAIKNICIRVRDAVIGFFKSIFDGVTKLRERAEKVKAAAESLPEAPKSDKIQLGGLAAKLAKGNTVDLKNDTVKGMISMVQGAVEFDSVVADDLNKRLAILRQATQTGERHTGDLNLKAPAAFSEHKDGRFSTPLLQGNVVFYIEPYKAGEGVKGAVANAAEKLFGNGYTVGKEQKDSTVDGAEIPTLGKSEIAQLGNECVELATAIEAAKSKVTNDKGFVNGLKQIKFSKELSGEQVSLVKADMKAFQRLATAQDQCSAKIIAWAINTGRAHLAVAEKSIAAYKGGKVEEKKEDKKDDKKAA